MRSIKTLKFLLIIFYCAFSSAQTTDLKFVEYEMDSKNQIKIEMYSELDSSNYLNVYMLENNKPTYYKYKLDSVLLVKLDSLNKKNFEEYIQTKKLEENHFYAGNKNFLSLKNSTKEQKICFIQPFMNPEFNLVIDSLQEIIYSQNENLKSTKFKINFKSIKKEIILQNQIDNYLPEKKLPPPVIMN